MLRDTLRGLRIFNPLRIEDSGQILTFPQEQKSRLFILFLFKNPRFTKFHYQEGIITDGRLFQGSF